MNARTAADFVLDRIVSRGALIEAMQLFSYSIETHLTIVFTVLVIILTITVTKSYATLLFPSGKKSRAGKRIAFFHPYCNSGGGGERVLWVVVQAMLIAGAPTSSSGRRRSTSKSKRPSKSSSSSSSSSIDDGGSKSIDRIYIYSGDIGISKQQILENVRSRFQIDLLSDPSLAESIEIAYIKSRWLLEASNYPVATMFFQSFASIVVGLECLLLNIVPDVFIDTTGAAFIYPVVKLLSRGSCFVSAYVHYPIISSDMLKIVRENRPQYNNRTVVAKSVIISSYKLMYYQLFTRLYRFVGRFADLVYVNSSWTRDHILSLWNLPSDSDSDGRRGVVLAYPPCNTDKLQTISMDRGRGSRSGERYIMSIGQFRPEKDHMLQLLSFETLKNKGAAINGGKSSSYAGVKLVLLGSTRNEEDELFVRNLRGECDKLKISDDVIFVVNCDFETMTEWLSRAHIGTASLSITIATIRSFNNSLSQGYTRCGTSILEYP